MSFVTAQMSLPVDVAATQGVISSELGRKLVQVQDQIEHMLALAKEQAEQIIAQARAQADLLLKQAQKTQSEVGQQAQQEARSLLEKINDEWKKIVGSIEPTAVAVARLAFDRVCAGASLVERIDAAARAAVRELPGEPVRICLSPRAATALGQNHWNNLPVTEDASLPEGVVRLEGTHGACEANFELARTQVSNVLEAWAERATTLLQRKEPPLAQI